MTPRPTPAPYPLRFGLSAWFLCGLTLGWAMKAPAAGVVFFAVGAVGLPLFQGRVPVRPLLPWLIPLLLWLVGTALLFPSLAKSTQPAATHPVSWLVFAWLGHHVWWGQEPLRARLMLWGALIGGLVVVMGLQGNNAILGHLVYWPLLVGALWWMGLCGLNTSVKTRQSAVPHQAVAGLAGLVALVGLMGLMARKPNKIFRTSGDSFGNGASQPSGENQPSLENQKPPPPPENLDNETVDRLSGLPEKMKEQLPPDWQEAMKRRQQEAQDLPEKDPTPENKTTDSSAPPTQPQEDKNAPLPGLDERDNNNAAAPRQDSPERTNGENNTPMGTAHDGAPGTPSDYRGGDNFGFGGGMDSREGRNRPPDNTPGAGSGLDREPGTESTAFDENGQQIPDGGGTGDGGTAGGNGNGGDGGQGGGGQQGGGDGGGAVCTDEKCSGGNFTNEALRKNPQAPFDWEGVPKTDDATVIYSYFTPKATRLRTQTLGFFDGKRWHPLEKMGGNRYHPVNVGLNLNGPGASVAALPDVNQSAEKRTLKLTLHKNMFGLMLHPAGAYYIKGPVLPERVNSEDAFFTRQAARKWGQWVFDFSPRVFHAGNSLPVAEDYFAPYLDNQHVSDHAAWVARAVAGQGPPIAKAMAIEGFLHNRFGYSANLPPVLSGSTLDTLLFDRHVGYCAQFAEAMALMAREVGLPARVVVGFATGEYVGASTFKVRGSDAHAWTEVNIPGAGWLEFDATPPPRRLKEDPLAGLPPYPGEGKWERTKPKTASQALKQNPLVGVAIALAVLVVSVGLLLWLIRKNRRSGESLWGFGKDEKSARLAEQLAHELQVLRQNLEAAGALRGGEQTPRELFRRCTADLKTASETSDQVELHLYGGKKLDGRSYLDLKGRLALLAKKQKDVQQPVSSTRRWD